MCIRSHMRDNIQLDSITLDNMYKSTEKDCLFVLIRTAQYRQSSIYSQIKYAKSEKLCMYVYSRNRKKKLRNQQYANNQLNSHTITNFTRLKKSFACAKSFNTGSPLRTTTKSFLWLRVAAKRPTVFMLGGLGQCFDLQALQKLSVCANSGTELWCRSNLEPGSSIIYVNNKTAKRPTR